MSVFAVDWRSGYRAWLLTSGLGHQPKFESWIHRKYLKENGYLNVTLRYGQGLRITPEEVVADGHEQTW